MHKLSFEIHPNDARAAEHPRPWLALLPFAALSGLLLWLAIF
jgi:hypothetical protein